MLEMCGLCMKNILGSHFPFSFVCGVARWIVCSLSQCYLPPIPRQKKSRASTAGSCQLYLPPLPFDLHCMGLYWMKSCIKTADTERCSLSLFLSLTLTHTHSHKTVKNGSKAKWLKHIIGNTQSSIHPYPSINPSSNTAGSVNKLWTSHCDLYELWWFNRRISSISSVWRWMKWRHKRKINLPLFVIAFQMCEQRHEYK